MSFDTCVHLCDVPKAKIWKSFIFLESSLVCTANPTIPHPLPELNTDLYCCWNRLDRSFQEFNVYEIIQDVFLPVCFFHSAKHFWNSSVLYTCVIQSVLLLSEECVIWTYHNLLPIHQLAGIWVVSINSCFQQSCYEQSLWVELCPLIWDVKVEMPDPCECDLLWQQGLHKCNQAKMRSF